MASGKESSLPKTERISFETKQAEVTSGWARRREERVLS